MRGHLIYLHGRIVQERQSPRPVHPEWGTYELGAIVETFRGRGFQVHSEIRPRAATVSDAADRLVGQVGDLLADGVPAERILVVGASMGAAITVTAAARLQRPDLRFAVLGTCLARNAEAVTAEEGRPPLGRFLAIREASDDLTEPCEAWPEDAPGPPAGPAVEELVLATGLAHGFLYRPLPAWVDPVAAWAEAAQPAAILPPGP
jgi:pimeloyl-ACP methyl ester carboxylesterase